MNRIALVLISSFIFIVGLPARTWAAVGPRCPLGALVIPAGYNIQKFLDAAGMGAALCLEGGTYRPSAMLKPKQGQGLYGVPGKTVITGTGLKYILEGSGGPSGVKVYDLVVEKAWTNIGTGNGWVVDGVISRYAAYAGFRQAGNGPIIRNSKALYNGIFGIHGWKSVNGSVIGTEIAWNNSKKEDPYYASGTKFVLTRYLVLRSNYAHDNYGHGLWLDMDNYGALIEYNTSSYNRDYSSGLDAGEGIRIEVSCNATIRGNTVIGNQSSAIGIESSDRDLLEDNKVVVPSGQTRGIRVVVQAHRTSEPKYVNCSGKKLKSAVYNTVRGNDIKMQGNDGSYNGVMDFSSGGYHYGNKFESNTYHVGSCGAKRWKWATSSDTVTVSFSTWRSGYGQDKTGGCGA